MEDRERHRVAPLQAGDMVPYFGLPDARSATGDEVTPWRYKGRRQMVLLFLHNGGCGSCDSLIADFAGHNDEYRAEEAEVLAVVPLPLAEARQLADRLSPPFPVLADEDCAVHSRFGAKTASGECGGAVYVTDRFGEVQMSWLAAEGHRGLPGHEEILSYLRFTNLECPE